MLRHFRVTALTAVEVQALLRELAERGIAGGPTNDALIARVAQNENVDYLVTANPDHFRRVAPALMVRIVGP